MAFDLNRLRSKKKNKDGAATAEAGNAGRENPKQTRGEQTEAAGRSSPQIPRTHR